MYASLSNQLYHMGHYAFAFILMMVVLPRFLFAGSGGRFLDRTVENYIKMVLTVIAIGYVLVLTKLFEVIGLVAVLAVLAMRGFFASRGAQKRVHTKMTVAATIYDVVDGRISLKSKFTEWIQSRKASAEGWAKGLLKAWTTLLQMALFLAVFGIATFTHLYDAMKSPAPALSDGYVTLAWMKYINQRILFHDGIYPQGFHIYLAFLQKFAAIDPLYILKYTGPIVSLLTMVALYYAVSRLTKSVTAGLLAAWVFGGVLGGFYADPWVRQAATNSQEFAFVFIFPTVYYFYQYLKDQEPADLWTGFAGISVIGLVHSLAYAIAALGIGCAVAANALLRFRETKLASLKVIAAGVLSGFVSLVPMGIGKVLGEGLNSSASDYLTSTTDVTSVYVPPFNALNLVALGCIGLLWIATIVNRKNRNQSATWLLGALFGTLIWLVFKFGGYTHSTVITSRSTDIWGVSVPFVIGMGLGALFYLAFRMKWKNTLELSLAACVIAVTCWFIPPKAITPYKMQWDDDIEAYLKISQEYRPTTYMIVAARDNYSIVLGSAFHMLPSDFLKYYDPTKPPLTRYGERDPDENIAPDVFVYLESPVFEVSKDNSIYSIEEPLYQSRKVDEAQLEVWIRNYKAAGHKVDIAYKGPHLTVYHFHRVEPVKKGG